MKPLHLLGMKDLSTITCMQVCFPSLTRTHGVLGSSWYWMILCSLVSYMKTRFKIVSTVETVEAETTAEI